MGWGVTDGETDELDERAWSFWRTLIDIDCVYMGVSKKQGYPKMDGL